MSKKTIVTFQVIDIFPDSKTTCSGRCAWRDGHDCDLFKVRLNPAKKEAGTTHCFRSVLCKKAEKELVVRLPDNDETPKGKEGDDYAG